MSWYSDLLREETTYWKPPGRDGLGGYVWGSPIFYKGKWQSVNNLVYDPSGAAIVSNTVVYIHLPVHPGGYLYKGTDASSPPDTARQIISVNSVNSLVEQSITVYKAFLR